MKTNNKLMSVALMAFLGIAGTLRAEDKVVSNPFLGVLSTTASAELPAKAADLVSKANAKTRSQATINIVKAAVGLNPAAAPAIVGTIAQSAPEMASVAAGTAVGLVPDQAEAIARAAAAAAPKQAGKIVAAMCKALPALYNKIANAVSEVVPGAGKEILQGVALAIPTLANPINQVLAANKGSVTSLSESLNQAAQVAKSDASGKDSLAAADSQAGLLAITPVVKPPYVAPVSTPVNINPGTGGQVPTGGRSYAAP